MYQAQMKFYIQNLNFSYFHIFHEQPKTNLLNYKYIKKLLQKEKMLDCLSAKPNRISQFLRFKIL